MKSNSLIICDLSDVMVKGLEGSETALAKQLHKTGPEVSKQLFSYDYTPLWYGYQSETTFFARFLKHVGWQISLQKLIDIIHSNFYEIEGTRAVYEALRELHTLVLYSVNCAEWVEVIRNVLDYGDLFEKEFYSYELKAHKKETSGFTRIKDIYPGYTYFLIDDSISNIRTAESLGIIGIRFTSNAQLVASLKEKGLL